MLEAQDSGSVPAGSPVHCPSPPTPERANWRPPSTRSAPRSDDSSALELRGAAARVPLQWRCSASGFSPAQRHSPTPGTEPCREWPKRPPRKPTSRWRNECSARRRETTGRRSSARRPPPRSWVDGSRNYRDDLAPEIRRIQRAVTSLGFTADGPPVTEQVPTDDARFDALLARINELLLRKGEIPERRTADRLHRVQDHAGLPRQPSEAEVSGGPDPDALRRGRSRRHGGQRARQRQGRLQRSRCRSPYPGLRRTPLLKDSTSTGPPATCSTTTALGTRRDLNSATVVLTRYGQARDVTVHHFDSSSDHDISFLGHVIRKANEIREDLGSANEIFDRAVRRAPDRGRG